MDVTSLIVNHLRLVATAVATGVAWRRGSPDRPTIGSAPQLAGATVLPATTLDNLVTRLKLADRARRA